MKRLLVCVLVGLAVTLGFGGCSYLSQFDRSYSVGYVGADGAQISGSVKLSASRGLEK